MAWRATIESWQARAWIDGDDVGRRCSRLPSHAALDQHLLDLADRLRRVETLRAGVGAVHDRVATVETERILEVVEPLARRLVAAVGEPAIGLQQRGRTQEAIRIPPV